MPLFDEEGTEFSTTIYDPAGGIAKRSWIRLVTAEGEESNGVVKEDAKDYIVHYTNVLK